MMKNGSDFLTVRVLMMVIMMVIMVIMMMTMIVMMMMDKWVQVHESFRYLALSCGQVCALP